MPILAVPIKTFICSSMPLMERGFAYVILQVRGLAAIFAMPMDTIKAACSVAAILAMLVGVCAVDQTSEMRDNVA